MSATGSISNYYVDSLISHETDEVLTTRLPAPEILPVGPRPSPLVAECSDFPSCSFTPKTTVFTSSWGPVHSQSSVVYHPYAHHQPHLVSEPRYVRSWLEPIPGAVSFQGDPSNGRHYGLKSDGFPELRPGECLPASARGYSDYYYTTPEDPREKTQATNSSAESDAPYSDKIKEDKPEVDPSKLIPAPRLHFLRY